MRAPTEPSPSSRPGSWIAVGLWAAVVIALLRGGVIWAMERLAHGVAADVARQRLAAALGDVALGSLLVALPVALVAGLALRLARRRALRALALAAVAAGGAFAFHAFLAGRLLADVAVRVGGDTERGRQASLVLAACALALAGATVLATLAGRERRPRLASLALPALLLALGPALWRTSYAAVSDAMVLSEVVVDLPTRPDLWEVVERHPKAAPHARVICPSPDVACDGADMPGIVLPPPALLRVALPADAGDLWLSARAGLDLTVIAQREVELAGHAVHFAVRVGGDTAFETAIPIQRVGEFTSSEWVRVGGETGLRLPPGAALELETRLVGPDGAEVEHPDALAVGFGGLTLEKRWNGERVDSSPERPNVVLIVMDTLRADRLSAYGYERETSPNVDRLAREGLLFEDAYATASWTWPSTASILTGLSPQQHGVEDEQSCYLAESLDTVAEALQRNGFTTAAFSANALIVPDKNFDQGFELFDHGKSATRQTPVFLPAALDWIDAVAGRRFFLYLHLADPHTPYVPLPEARERFAPDVTSALPESAVLDYQNELLAGCGRDAHGDLALDDCVPPEHRAWISDLYDACVWTGDHWVGQVLERLEAAGIDDETIVVFTSDHGEELFDHGFGLHGQSLHRELVQVPLVMAGPGIPRGLRVATPVSNRHVAPTLAHLGGAELRGPEDALDLVAAARAGEVPARPILYSTNNGWWNGRWRLPIHGLREGDDVLHWAPAGGPWGVAPGSAADPADGELRLYDVGADPDENRDLAVERAARAAELRRELEARLDALEAKRAAPAIPAGESTLGFLRDIGYIGEE